MPLPTPTEKVLQRIAVALESIDQSLVNLRYIACPEHHWHRTECRDVELPYTYTCALCGMRSTLECDGDPAPPAAH